MTSLSTLRRRWMKDPAFRKEYDALEEEFALMAEVLKARQRSGLSWAKIARRIKATPRAKARLENGRELSMETLLRFAKATGHRLKISFEPVKANKRGRTN